MARDPFEEIEEKMEEIMKGDLSGGRGISIKQTPEGTTVDVSGDVPDEEIERIKERYPDAEIRIDGKSVDEEEGPVIEVLDEDKEGTE